MATFSTKDMFELLTKAQQAEIRKQIVEKFSKAVEDMDVQIIAKPIDVTRFYKDALSYIFDSDFLFDDVDLTKIGRAITSLITQQLSTMQAQLKHGEAKDNVRQNNSKDTIAS